MATAALEKVGHISCPTQARTKTPDDLDRSRGRPKTRLNWEVHDDRLHEQIAIKTREHQSVVGVAKDSKTVDHKVSSGLWLEHASTRPRKMAG